MEYHDIVGLGSGVVNLSFIGVKSAWHKSRRQEQDIPHLDGHRFVFCNSWCGIGRCDDVTCLKKKIVKYKRGE